MEYVQFVKMLLNKKMTKNKPVTAKEFKKQVKTVKDMARTKPDEREKCCYCKDPIHVSNWGGVNHRGFFCANIICLIKMAEDKK